MTALKNKNATSAKGDLYEKIADLKVIAEDFLRISRKRAVDSLYAYGAAERAAAFGFSLWLLTDEREYYALHRKAWDRAKKLRARLEKTLSKRREP
jgi:hypothetical protein